MIKALLRAGLVVAALVGYGSTAIAADYNDPRNRQFERK